MTTTVHARTARKPHMCEQCHHWIASLRGVATIAPGHRYLRHTAFPDGEINTSDRPYVLAECVACAEPVGRGYLTGACRTFCCGDVPCARPVRHDGDHSCRRCYTGGRS